MWRIYSNKHGVRITFDLDDIKEMINAEIKNKFKSNEPKLFFQKVKYRSDYPVFDSKRITIDQYMKKSIMTKRIQFMHEKEYRFSFLHPNYTEMPTSKKIRTIAKGDNPLSNLLVVKNGVQLLANRDNLNIPDIITYYIDIKKIKTIVLDPRAEKYHTEAFINYCKSKKLDRFGVIFGESELYKIKKQINLTTAST